MKKALLYTKSLEKSEFAQKEREREREEALVLSICSCSLVHKRERERDKRGVGGKQLFNLAFSYGIRMEFNKVKLSPFLFPY